MRMTIIEKAGQFLVKVQIGGQNHIFDLTKKDALYRRMFIGQLYNAKVGHIDRKAA